MDPEGSESLAPGNSPIDVWWTLAFSGCLENSCRDKLHAWLLFWMIFMVLVSVSNIWLHERVFFLTILKLKFIVILQLRVLLVNSE